jgi:hypothetical protein
MIFKYIDEYCFSQSDVLGFGSSSVVYKGRNTINGELVAIKDICFDNVL